jgi:orotate phosphoribosyltransferase
MNKRTSEVPEEGSQANARSFLSFCIRSGVMLFGEFTTKAGRLSPYFFNAGLFYDGESLDALADYYADAIIASRIKFDVLFGPAYKGIPLAAVVLTALARKGHNVCYAYNRKEAKDHGEGGTRVGAPIKGKRVLLIDDVMSAGTAVRESVALLVAEEATFAGVVISLDRQERGKGDLSATQEVEETYGVPVISIATLNDLIEIMESNGGHASLSAIKAYREQYGAK